MPWEYTYAELRGLFVTGGAERHRALEEELEDANAAASGDQARFTVALTIVALTV